MESESRFTSRDMQAGRREQLRRDLMAVERSSEYLVRLLENLQKSLSVAPITSHDWMYKLLSAQMNSASIMLSVSIEAWKDIAEEEESR